MISEDARFRKIKHVPSDGATEVYFESPVMGGFDDHMITTRQAPHPDFLKALQALAPVVIEVAELKGVAKPADVEVRGVSLAYNKNETVGCIITAMRTLKRSGPMLINTPTKLLEAGEESGADSQLPDYAVGIIDALFRETRLFLTGKRAQLEMFGDGQTETTPAAGTDPEQFPIEAYALKAALILSGLYGNPGEKAFDKLDKDFPEANKIVYLGRAPLELLREMTPQRRASLYALAVEVLLGGNLQEGDSEELDRLALETATHGATLAPFFEPWPIVEGEYDGGPVPISHDEEVWSQLTRGRLEQIVKVAEEGVAIATIGSVIADRLLQYADLADFQTLDLEALVELNGYIGGPPATNPADEPPAFRELVALWESRANPEPKEEEQDNGEVAKPAENPTDPEILESLAGVSNWLDYKAHCLRFGIKCKKADYQAIEKERTDNRPGYRDPQLRDEVAERRRSAQKQTAEAKSRLPALENEDLLGQ